MAEKGGTKKKKKILYSEPLNNYKRRKRILLFPLLFPVLYILIGLIFIIDYISLSSGIDNIIPFSIILIILGILAMLAFYYLSYKPLNRFVMYDNGFYTSLRKNFINYNDINYARIKYYQYLSPVIHILYGEKHEIYSKIPELEMKKIIKILKTKGVNIKIGDYE